MLMKRLAVATSLLASLAASSAALAVVGPSGTYKTLIVSNALKGELKGAWTIAFTSGTYTVETHSTVVVRGKYSVEGTRITFGHETGAGACPASGIYTFHPSGKKLTFVRINDPKCAARSVVLAGSFTETS
jgi:hypothetical protein